jgi:hypothetical protein
MGLPFLKISQIAIPVFFFVVARNLIGRQGLGHRDWPMKVVSVRGSKTRDWIRRLRPCRSEFGMRMGDSSDGRELFVQLDVGRQIG